MTNSSVTGLVMYLFQLCLAKTVEKVGEVRSTSAVDFLLIKEWWMKTMFQKLEKFSVILRNIFSGALFRGSVSVDIVYCKI